MEDADIYKHHQTYDEMQNSIVSVIESELKQAILKSPFVGLMADETSDIVVNKKLIIYVRLIENGVAETKYACNVKVKDGKAETIFNVLLKFCNDMEIDINKVSGLGVDGASVMLGHLTGVGARMQQLNECIILVHCIAHRLYLATARAANTIKYLVTFQKVINQLYAFFSTSAVRYEKLRAMVDVLDVEIKKLKQPSSARWLSVHGALDAILHDYEHLVLVFDQISTTPSSGDAKGKAKAQGLWKYVRNVKCLCTVALLVDALGIITILSKQFQSEQLNLGKIHPSIQAALSSLEIMKTVDGSNLSKVKKELIYDTTTGVIKFNNVLLYDNPSKQTEFQNLRNNYLSNLIQYIKERFPDTSLDLLTCFDITLNPQRIPSKANPADLAKHGKIEFLKLLDFF